MGSLLHLDSTPSHSGGLVQASMTPTRMATSARRASPEACRIIASFEILGAPHHASPNPHNAQDSSAAVRRLGAEER
ncbi:hypothetical protein OPT61_g10217 [Boeremia exigua]|uniref:Uncharacterized protein n=1 Tax=Boeremia exigua TaxID=749465 RepID=A0ACC2HS73_9PLEO|nr:hypothetical protein OPT61_g10217 [Boeremia exigua]